jgi:hypothetical protein
VIPEQTKIADAEDVARFAKFPSADLTEPVEQRVRGAEARELSDLAELTVRARHEADVDSLARVAGQDPTRRDALVVGVGVDGDQAPCGGGVPGRHVSTFARPA